MSAAPAAHRRSRTTSAATTGNSRLEGRRPYRNLLLLWLVLAAAAVAVINAGMRIELGAGVTTGCVLALALLPLWLSTALRYRHFPWLLGLTVASVASGVWLTAASSSTYEVSWSLSVQNSALLAASVLGTGLILWLRPVLSEWQIGLLFGLGLLAEATTVPGLDNPWKYQWAMPVAVLALAGAQALHSRLLGVLALFGLVVVSAALDSRSLTGMFLVAGVVLTVQALPLTDRIRRMGAVRMIVLVGAVGAVAYWLFTRLALNGTLGLATQLRTEEQVLRAGSVLLGGRHEMAATAGLSLHRPMGFSTVPEPKPSGRCRNSPAVAAISGRPPSSTEPARSICSSVRSWVLSPSVPLRARRVNRE